MFMVVVSGCESGCCVLVFCFLCGWLLLCAGLLCFNLVVFRFCSVSRVLFCVFVLFCVVDVFRFVSVRFGSFCFDLLRIVCFIV